MESTLKLTADTIHELAAQLNDEWYEAVEGVYRPYVPTWGEETEMVADLINAGCADGDIVSWDTRHADPAKHLFLRRSWNPAHQGFQPEQIFGVETGTELAGRFTDDKALAKEVPSEYGLCLYSDFTIPEMGESKPLGRVLDEEIRITYSGDEVNPEEEPTYKIGNNRTAGWRILENPEPRRIWEAFEEIAKDKLFWEAMNQRGGKQATGYWWQKFVNGREPGSHEWKEWSANAPEIRSPRKS